MQSQAVLLTPFSAGRVNWKHNKTQDKHLRNNNFINWKNVEKILSNHGNYILGDRRLARSDCWLSA
jgi:hypothetical protein